MIGIAYLGDIWVQRPGNLVRRVSLLSHRTCLYITIKHTHTHCWVSSRCLTCHPSLWDCPISVLGLEHSLIWKTGVEVSVGSRVFFISRKLSHILGTRWIPLNYLHVCCIDKSTNKSALPAQGKEIFACSTKWVVSSPALCQQSEFTHCILLHLFSFLWVRLLPTSTSPSSLAAHRRCSGQRAGGPYFWRWARLWSLLSHTMEILTWHWQLVLPAQHKPTVCQN